jgi:hypothetical protein
MPETPKLPIFAAIQGGYSSVHLMIQNIAS